MGCIGVRLAWAGAAALSERPAVGRLASCPRPALPDVASAPPVSLLCSVGVFACAVGAWLANPAGPALAAAEKAPMLGGWTCADAPAEGAPPAANDPAVLGGVTCVDAEDVPRVPPPSVFAPPNDPIVLAAVA